MKKIQSKSKMILLFGLMAFLLTYTGCKDDDEKDNKSALLIGEWTIDDADITATIQGMSIKDFFMNVGGLGEAEAELYATIFEALLGSSFSGTIEFKDDNTYESFIAGELDDGTWSMNSDGTVITLDGGTSDETAISVITLTSSMMKGSFNTSEFADIDDDPATPDVEIDIDVVLTLVK